MKALKEGVVYLLTSKAQTEAQRKNMENQNNSADKQAKSNKKLVVSGSRQLPSWLFENQISLAFTTYQFGKIFFVSSPTTSEGKGRLAIFERTVQRCMGLAGFNDDLYMSSLYQVHKFVSQNRQVDVEGKEYPCRLYIPQVNYITGDIDVHDMAVEKDGRLVFINTLFNCLATVSEQYSFKPLWQPPFISKLVAEDRCHLNGLALKDGKAKYVTAVSQTDIIGGWREKRIDGGVVIDIETNEIVATGLSMPHSPRWYDGSLYLHNTGTGYFGRLDVQTGKFEEITFCPGFLRGLSIYKNFAVLGISKCRNERTFQGLALDNNLKEKNVESRCSLFIVDLKTGEVAHTLDIEGFIEELFDVLVLENTFNAQAVGFRSDEIRHILSIEN